MIVQDLLARPHSSRPWPPRVLLLWLAGVTSPGLVLAGGSTTVPVPPDMLRMTGAQCHAETEGRIFMLNGTLRGRPHWVSQEGRGEPLHISWTPSTPNFLGLSMVGGWRIDVSVDLDELNGGDGPRVARANIDTPFPPFGTSDPDRCVDKMYCTEGGGAWREKCTGDSAYHLSPIVLEQHFPSVACAACATGCPQTNGTTGVICECCSTENGAFVGAAPPTCTQRCDNGRYLVSHPCVYPPVCQKNTAVDVKTSIIICLVFILGAMTSQMVACESVKDVPWNPERAEDSLSDGPAGLLRRWERGRAVCELQAARSPAYRGGSGSGVQKRQSADGLSSGLMSGSDSLSHMEQDSNPAVSRGSPGEAGEALQLPDHSGWLTELERDQRVFVELRGAELSLWSIDTEESAESGTARKELGRADLQASIVTELPAWKLNAGEDGELCNAWMAARDWLRARLDGRGAQSRLAATQRFAFGFTLELAQPDTAGATIYTFCSNRPIRQWSDLCLQAAGAGPPSSHVSLAATHAWMYVAECSDVDNIPLGALGTCPAQIGLNGTSLVLTSYGDDISQAVRRSYHLEEHTVELVTSFRNSRSAQVIGCVLHVLQALFGHPVPVLVLLLLIAADDGALETDKVQNVGLFVLGSLCGVPWAWSLMSRTETIETFALVARPGAETDPEASSCSTSIVVRCASKRERDAWMKALSQLSTGGIQGFSLAFLKRFVQQNQDFMSQKGREYVSKTDALRGGRTQTGKVAAWDPSLVEVEMDITATTTNTTYELIKPMTEKLQATYVTAAQAASDEIADADVTELYAELFDMFDQQKSGWLGQTEWTAFLQAVHAPRGEGDISIEERDRQQRFYELEDAAEMLGVQLNDHRISRSDFSLLYRLRDAKTDYNMCTSCRGISPSRNEVPTALYLDPERDVGPATVFVSHTWNRPFTELVESLELEERRQIERAGNYNIQKVSLSLSFSLCVGCVRATHSTLCIAHTVLECEAGVLVSARMAWRLHHSLATVLDRHLHERSMGNSRQRYNDGAG